MKGSTKTEPKRTHTGGFEAAAAAVVVVVVVGAVVR